MKMWLHSAPSVTVTVLAALLLVGVPAANAQPADPAPAATSEAPAPETAAEAAEADGQDVVEGASEAEGDDADAGEGEGEGADDAAAQTQSAAAPTSPFDSLRGRPDAPSLSTDDLWEAYDEASERFDTLLRQSEDQEPLSTTGNRVYYDTIGAGLELRDILRALLGRGDELTEDERVVGMDSLLTIEQVIGTLLVEVQQCERGQGMLQQLLENPELQSRPVLVDSTERWLRRATRCLERQELETQLERSQEAGFESELEQLRRELALAQTREEEAREQAQQTPAGADGAPGITLTRTELMEILRLSAEERRRAYEDASADRGPRAPRMEYGFAIHSGVIGTPQFLLGLLFSENTNHWSGDYRNYSVGGEFFFRRQRSSQLSLGVNYAYVGAPDGWWVRNNKPEDAKWTVNDMGLLGIYFGYEGIAPVGPQQRFQFTFGLRIGVNIVTGDFVQTEVNEACLVGSSESEAFRLGGPCLPTADTPQLDPSTRDGSVVPPVLPTLGFGIGMRYMIADRVQIGVETGYRDVYFYGTANVGVIFARRQ